MAEYIEREKLLDELGESASYHAESGREYQLLLRDRNIAREQPTADVIERTEFEKVVKSFKTMVEMKNENLIDMRDKYYALEKEYAELKVNIRKAIEEIEKLPSRGSVGMCRTVSLTEVLDVLENIGESRYEDSL